LKTAAG